MMYNVFFTVAFGTRSLKVTALVYSLGWGVFSALAGSSLPILQAAFFSPDFSEPKQIPTCCLPSGAGGSGHLLMQSSHFCKIPEMMVSMMGICSPLFLFL